MNKKEILIDDVFIVNPVYKIRNDVKRCRIENNNSFYFKRTDEIENIESGFSWSLHPDLAYLFAEFDEKKSLKEVIKDLSLEYDFSEEEVFDIFSKYIENEERICTPIVGSKCCILPKHFLIKQEKGIKSNVLNKEEILKIMKEDIDLTSFRHYIPSEITLMLNNKCVVDCEYCYADKSVNVKSPLPFNRVKEIISEASHLGLRDVSVDGGEFFLYPYWKELIDELREHEYYPYISTKYPLTKEMVYDLKEKGIYSIQVSLDSVNEDELVKILNVGKDYLAKMQKAIEYLNEAEIEITIKPVITKYNDSTDSIINLLNYLNTVKMVKKVNLAPVSYSIYKNFDFSSTLEKYNEIRKMIEQQKDKFNFTVFMQGENIEMSQEQKIKNFPQRSLCSGNMSSFFILPDGKVTICEQMYWHPFFIMGDLSTQSIMEVWNGEKALSLWNYDQEEIREISPCKHCVDFEECRRGQGNCWRIAISAYGEENYDFPAPNCPKALPVTRPFYTPEK
ncbi:MAG: radical SAM protein [Bacteroidales bacterium]|jgi:radical SAM protein with 4Fe4S-binding SPASM domain|nr:radical SAM protein [Bacteroidales bacterium]